MPVQQKRKKHLEAGQCHNLAMKIKEKEKNKECRCKRKINDAITYIELKNLHQKIHCTFMGCYV